MYKQVVNVLARRDNPNEPYLSCVFQPLTRARWASTGSAAEIGLFAFQRRCFDVAWRGWTRWAANLMRGYASVQQRGLLTGIEPGRHIKTPLGPKRHIDTSTCPNVVGALHQSDALYSRARRANFQTVSQEQSYKVMVGLALRNRGALEIMKSDAMRAVVLPGWPNGEHHPMGPCYL